MSLFASLGQGDIWSLSGISFASPINDLLDKGTFSLEELLNEDELIQEVKAKNDRLLEFLCCEESIEKMLDFVIRPAHEDEDNSRKFRFPYMSCEVICCEIPEILTKLVEYRDGFWLDHIFLFLEQSGPLDCYLAGYFEKILEMLFRKMTSQMMIYLNHKGLPLFRQFLRHIRNYSIMQIVQRLMLPHLPFANPDSDVLNFDDSKEIEQCNWSFLPEACEDLLHVMLHPIHSDEPLHVSDMLITVVQLSPPETLLIKFLCKPESVKALLLAATDDSINPSLEDETAAANTAGAMLSGQVSLSAASVLESLVSRLFESGFSIMLASTLDGEMPDQSQTQQEAEQEALTHVHDLLRSICDEVAPLLHRLSSLLLHLLERAQQVRQRLAQELTVSDTESVLVQSKMRLPRLGHLGLQAVKLVEALVRLNSLKVDDACRETGLLAVCLRMFLVFDFHSVLHLSVQRIFVSIFEAPISRAGLQMHLCRECGLLEVLMSRVGLDLLPRDAHSDFQQEVINENSDIRFVVPEVRELISDHQQFRFSARHSSLAGHLVLIAHAAFLLLAGRDPIADEDFEGDELQQHHDNGESGVDVHQNGASKSERLQRAINLRRLMVSSPNNEVETSTADEEDETLATNELLQRWDDFVERRFKKVLEHQLLSGPLTDAQSTAPSSANTSAESLQHSHTMHHHLAQTMLMSLGGGFGGDEVAFEERFEDDEFDTDELRHMHQSSLHDDHDIPSHFKGFEHQHGFGHATHTGHRPHFNQHLAQFSMTHADVPHPSDAEFRPFDDFDDTDVDHHVHPHHVQIEFNDSAFDKEFSADGPVVSVEDVDLASHVSEDDPFAGPGTPVNTVSSEDAVFESPPNHPTEELSSFDAFANFESENDQHRFAGDT